MTAINGANNSNKHLRTEDMANTGLSQNFALPTSARIKYPYFPGPLVLSCMTFDEMGVMPQVCKAWKATYSRTAGNVMLTLNTNIHRRMVTKLNTWAARKVKAAEILKTTIENLSEEDKKRLTEAHETFFKQEKTKFDEVDAKFKANFKSFVSLSAFKAGLTDFFTFAKEIFPEILRLRELVALDLPYDTMNTFLMPYFQKSVSGKAGLGVGEIVGDKEDTICNFSRSSFNNLCSMGKIKNLEMNFNVWLSSNPDNVVNFSGIRIDNRPLDSESLKKLLGFLDSFVKSADFFGHISIVHTVAHLRLSCNSIVDVGDVLAFCNKFAVRHLCLSLNPLNTKSIKEIAAFMLRPGNKLTYIDLGGNEKAKETFQGIGDEGFEAMENVARAMFPPLSKSVSLSSLSSMTSLAYKRIIMPPATTLRQYELATSINKLQGLLV